MTKRPPLLLEAGAIEGDERMDYVDLGKRIRKQRIYLKWTQEELAHAIGVSTSFVGHIERGTRKASLETLVLLANSMRVSVDYLLEGSLTRLDDRIIPSDLSANQRSVMEEILAVMQKQLKNWSDD